MEVLRRTSKKTIRKKHALLKESIFLEEMIKIFITNLELGKSFQKY